MFTEKTAKNNEINYKHAVVHNISKVVLENDSQVTYVVYSNPAPHKVHDQFCRPLNFRKTRRSEKNIIRLVA